MDLDLDLTGANLATPYSLAELKSKAGILRQCAMFTRPPSDSLSSDAAADSDSEEAFFYADAHDDFLRFVGDLEGEIV